MRIYTKTGDDGTTGLFYGGRVRKDSAGPEAYGAVDEAVTALGVVRALAAAEDPLMAEEVLRVQREMFVVAAELATAPDNRSKLEDDVSRVTASMVAGTEAAIDRVVTRFGLPSEFVVPGNNQLTAALDVARTVLRRAERRAVTYAAEGGLDGSHVLPYLNRVADYIYVLARAADGTWTSSRTEEES